MKVLLDHNLDRRLREHLADFTCSTTHAMGWDRLTNGELLSAAEEDGFEVLLTADSNIKYQQNLKDRRIAVIILRAPNNRLTTHIKMLDKVKEQLPGVQAGTIIEVFF